ncbi:class II fructose-bisphosphate aldolase [Lysinibacter sp. HNR]|uniref:class II fructose-bisphosphate aldolase n=1 Tax=Lysinibacter sp. HNR TaxID=3031408 RepID=UPI00243589F6|nr:class II fructose-bisphosphate aldolase [Lysinibacter sp. HNR]WGD38029.1 class II fructose-bisphosphate aldolase [Lysinibacter sp. HNR]
MPLVNSASLIEDARSHNRGIGAFNVIHLETAEALDRAARSSGPLIMQISQNCAAYHGELETIALPTLSIARNSTAPIAVHLDHADNFETVRQAIHLGFSSVMFDASALPYAENVAKTAEVVEYAHTRGVHVEAELGEIGGKDGAHAPGVRTDPVEAAKFVEETGVDSLAVAVGSSHAMTQRTATVDHKLIRDLARALSVPLVLHGSSGVPDGDIVTAIRSGMTKINVSTQLNKIFTASLRETLEDNPDMVDSRKYIRPARVALSVEAARLNALFALRTTAD